MLQKFGRKPRETRRHSNERAWIAQPGTFGIRECRILNQSAGGARLSTKSAEPLPRFFHLTSSPARREGRKCELRWRKGTDVGVRFVD